MNRVALHEAGHALAFFTNGIPVRRVVIYSNGGGECMPFREPREPDAAVLIALAGGAAEAICMDRPNPSPSDCRLADEALTQLGVVPMPRAQRHALAIAGQFIWRHVDEIAFLANELERRRQLGADDIGRLIHHSYSPLKAFRSLYPTPTRPARTPAPTLDRRAAEPAGRLVQLADGSFVRRVPSKRGELRRVSFPMFA